MKSSPLHWRETVLWIAAAASLGSFALVGAAVAGALG